MPQAPGLSEIATTTLRNRAAKGSSKMPSHSVKQAKVMSAIAHGWRPKGKVADIPVKVAKEFHAADAGKKYGHKKYDRSGHQPGNPGFNREGAAPYKQFDGGAHAKQPHGHSIGNAPEHVAHRPNQTFTDEQREHGARQTEGSMGKGTHKNANIDSPFADGSSLLEKCGAGHTGQPGGHPTGEGQGRRYPTGPGTRIGAGTAHSFKYSSGGQGFGHPAHLRSGPLRMSGHSGAHRIGARKK